MKNIFYDKNSRRYEDLSVSLQANSEEITTLRKRYKNYTSKIRLRLSLPQLYLRFTSTLPQVYILVGKTTR